VLRYIVYRGGQLSHLPEDHIQARRIKYRYRRESYLVLLIAQVLTSISVTFGQTAAGNSFNESYPGFQNDIVQPYLAWLKNVYGMFSPFLYDYHAVLRVIDSRSLAI